MSSICNANKIPKYVRGGAWSLGLLNLVCWYDCSDLETISSVGPLVTQLDDKSGNDHHLTKTVGAFSPSTGIRSLNNLNVLDFDGDDFISTTITSFPQNCSFVGIFIVDAVDTTGDSIFSINNNAGGDYDFQIESASTSVFNARLRCSGNKNNTIGFSYADPTNNPFSGNKMFSYKFEFLQEVESYINGDAEPFGFVRFGSAGQAIYTNTANHPDGFICGPFATTQILSMMCDKSQTAVLDGALAEFVIINSVSDSDRQKAEGKLSWKWGMQGDLPIGHPYKSGPPEG